MDVCVECGTTVKGREYHPYEFCVLYKAGLDPWRFVREAAEHLQRGRMMSRLQEIHEEATP